jgi:hypothetical protein
VVKYGSINEKKLISFFYHKIYNVTPDFENVGYYFYNYLRVEEGESPSKYPEKFPTSWFGQNKQKFPTFFKPAEMVFLCPLQPYSLKFIVFFFKNI